jgi:protein-L-isoaspartate O-methyltransferase
MGGRLVAPVGSIDSQRLLVGTRGPSGLETRFLGVCRFVPLVGPEGFVPGP